jgi:WD40 repeat protein
MGISSSDSDGELSPVLCADVSSRGHFVVAAGSNNTITKTLVTHTDTTNETAVRTHIHRPLRWDEVFGDNNRNHAAASAVSTPTLTAGATAAFSPPGTSCVSVRSDDRVCVSGHWDGTVRMWDTKRLKHLVTLR